MSCLSEDQPSHYTPIFSLKLQPVYTLPTRLQRAAHITSLPMCARGPPGTLVPGPFQAIFPDCLRSLQNRSVRACLQISSVMGSISFARKPHSESPLNIMMTAYWSSKAALNMQVGLGDESHRCTDLSSILCSVNSRPASRTSVVWRMYVARSAQHRYHS